MSIHKDNVIYKFLNLDVIKNAAKGPDGQPASLAMAAHFKDCYRMIGRCKYNEEGGAKKSRRRKRTRRKKRRRRRKSTKKKRRRRRR